MTGFVSTGNTELLDIETGLTGQAISNGNTEFMVIETALFGTWPGVSTGTNTGYW